jgi:hypothetical protein
VRRWVIALLLILLLVPASGWSQSSANVVLESNEQLFCILAALNATGYDTGMGTPAADDSRAKVREFLQARQAAAAPDLAKFYTQHRVAGDPGADLGQYVSLALLIGPPPEFKLTVPEDQLPPDARDVAGFIPLLRTFYNQGSLLSLWAELQPRYDASVARYTAAVRDSFVRTEAYFRFPSGGYLGRTYTIYIDLLGVPEQVQARIYGLNYYLVVTPSKDPKIDEVRHQYLHFLLDPLAAKYAAEINQKASLGGWVRQAPMLSLDFKEDFPLLVTECLIRAAELRIDKRSKPDAEKSVKEMMGGGLILVRYFYDALANFEKQESSMNIYYKEMILGIDLKAEAQELATLQFTPRPPAAPGKVAPARSERDRLLDQGDNQFFQGKYLDAKASYQAVLEKLDPNNERALYGMAVVYANTRKPDLAEEYLLKTVDTAHDLRIVSWSHIYLGRLYDLRGKRDAALAQYHAAALTAAAYPLAARAVESGLAQAFGSPDGGKKE